SAAPASMAVNARGSRTAVTTTIDVSPLAARPLNASSTRPTGNHVEPTTSESTNMTPTATTRSASITGSRLGIFGIGIGSDHHWLGSSSLRHAHVPLERMIGCEVRLKDLDEIGEHQIRLRHAAGPVVVGAGRGLPQLVDPHASVAVGLECGVPR